MMSFYNTHREKEDLALNVLSCNNIKRKKIYNLIYYFHPLVLYWSPGQKKKATVLTMLSSGFFTDERGEIEEELLVCAKLGIKLCCSNFPSHCAGGNQMSPQIFQS